MCYATRHIIVQMLKDTEKILKTSRKKPNHHMQRNTRLTADFSWVSEGQKAVV